MMDFKQPWDYGDVTFIIEDKRIYANKANLAMSSEVFKALFPSDFKEEKMTEIPLPDKKFDDFLQLMQILHPPHTMGVDGSNVECVLPLAHEYQIHHVVDQCEKYLLTQPASIHNLILADKFSLTNLRQVCIEYMKDVPYSKLQQDQEFEMIDKDILFEIFQNKFLGGNDLSAGVTYKLMSEPPSVQNFLNAEKCDVPELYDKCLKYLKDAPLSQLKAEPGYTELKPDTLIEVLSHKGEQLETLKVEVSNICNWVQSDQQEPCLGRGEGYIHDTGTDSACPRCNKYSCTRGHNHRTGSNRGCLECNKSRFDEICEVVKKC